MLSQSGTDFLRAGDLAVLLMSADRMLVVVYRDTDDRRKITELILRWKAKGLAPLFRIGHCNASARETCALPL